jgi:REP element-mobilizing transposase RayT
MPTRKATRLSCHDYATPGAYFVTVCAARRGPVFGRLHGETVVLDAVGSIVAAQLAGVADRLPGVSLDAWIVMPDHLHAIVLLEQGRSRLGSVVGAVKSGSTRESRAHRAPGRLWQRGYYDHVVRDEADLERVREYITTNPVRAATRVGGEARLALALVRPRATQGSPLPGVGTDPRDTAQGPDPRGPERRKGSERGSSASITT